MFEHCIDNRQWSEGILKCRFIYAENNQRALHLSDKIICGFGQGCL